MTAVAFHDVWMRYGEQLVLERINLDIAPHSFCSVVGASGSGKTTLLRLLLSQDRPTRGRILVDGAPIAPEPGPDRAVVFQRYSVFPHLTALQNVVLGLEFASSKFLGRLFGAARRRAVETAAAMLESVGLGASLDKCPAAMSGGMQQRLAIAQALVKKPRVLLLDEPFGALDPGTRVQMHDLVRSLWESSDMTVFLVTHDIQEGFSLGTRVLVLDKVRHDAQAPNAYGATVTYDIPLHRRTSGQ